MTNDFKKLSIAQLYELKENLNSIIENKEKEEYDWELPEEFDLSLEEKRKFLKDDFLYNIEELSKLLLEFKKDKLVWYDNVQMCGGRCPSDKLEKLVQLMLDNGQLRSLDIRTYTYLFPNLKN